MNNKNFQFKDSEFIKSSMSRGSRKQCVEVAINNNGIGVRDSKDKNKITLNFTHRRMGCFY